MKCDRMICKEMYNNSKKEFYDMNIEAKRVTDSMAETVHIVRPNHLNGANRLFGGILMQWIDEVAGIVAKRHAMANVITASVDNLRFIKGAYQNEMVVIVGKLTHKTYGKVKERTPYHDDGYRFPLTVINCNKYKSEATNSKNVHPTQKPVKLLEYLIKTYTKENDLVLDFTMGTGTTGRACLNTSRQFIGIEQDEKWFNIAQSRLSEKPIVIDSDDILEDFDF